MTPEWYEQATDDLRFELAVGDISVAQYNALMIYLSYELEKTKDTTNP